MEASSSTDSIKISYNVWKQFDNKFAIVLSGNYPNLPPNEKKRYSAILQEIFETYPTHCKHLVPPNTKDESTIEHYTLFNIWLFGQFVSVYLREYYDNHNNKCLEAQIALLQFVSEKNPIIYSSLIRCYVKMFEDLCRFTSQPNPVYDAVFKWFHLDGNPLMSLTPPKFKLENAQRFIEAINLTLRIFISQISHISVMCTVPLKVLWRCSVTLLRHHEFDKSICYHFLTRLIRENVLPSLEKNFNPVLSELLRLIVNDIGKLCQSGRIRGEDEFCALLNILGERIDSEVCFDFSYINSIYCLIYQCQIPLAESTEDAVLTFFAKLLNLSSSEPDLFAMTYENNTQPLNLSLSAIALESTVQKQIEQICKNAQTLSVNLPETNKNWNFLISCMIRYIQEVEKKLSASSIKQTVAVLKSVLNITKAAVNVCYRFNINLVFFGDEIYKIVTKLVKIMEVFFNKKILLIFSNILKNILMLPEIRNMEENKRTFLLSLLSLPLPSFDLTTPLPNLFHDKYRNLIDDEVKISSLKNMMWVRDLEMTYKYKLFGEIFACTGGQGFQNLAVITHRLNEDELRSLEEYLFNADDQVLTQLSPFIRQLICALDGRCVLSKLPDGNDVQLYCTICDARRLPDTPKEHSESAYRRRIINRLICSVIQASNEAKLNVLSDGVELSHHISTDEYETFLTLLHNCYISEDEKIRRKIVQITPQILFNDILTKQNLDYKMRLHHNKFDSFILSLQDVLVRAVIDEESTMQYYSIKTISQIGSVPIEMTLFPCIHLLINPLMLAPSRSSSLAKSAIEQIVRTHDQIEEHIYLKFRDNLFPLITHIIVINFTVYKVDLYSLHFDYATIFNSHTQPHILKYLLPHAVHYPEVQRIVSELADMNDIPVGQMLLNGFRHIFLHVMLFEEQEKAASVLKLIESEIGEKISNLLGGCVAKVSADLLIYYEEKPEKVQWAILATRKLLTGSPLEQIISSSQPELSIIVAFVQHRFFGIIMSLENQLSSDYTPNKTRRQIIASLKLIIELMGSAYITSVRFKMLLTLRSIISTEKNKSPQQCIQLWDTFVRSIDRKVLGPILSTIFVSLLPFNENYATEINDIFRYLVVENEDAVRDHLHELYFVQPHQCDDRTLRVIRSSETFSRMSLEKRLDWLAELSQHEIVEIKLHALKRLKNELSDHHSEISQLILASDSINSLIPKVLNVIVEGFRNHDENIQEASGICLGEFGAIDPSYIPNTVIKINDAKKYKCYSIDDLEFVINTLTVLCRGLQTAKNNTVMDAFALAIQTTLKSYNVTDDESCPIWSKIAKNLREIIQPFHTTTYVLLSPDNEASDNIPHLIYSTRNCTSVQKWAQSWSNFLISLLPVGSKERNIFHCFKGVISYDYECMLLFLPHILHNAVLSASESNLIKINEEMMSVIRDDRSGSRTEQSERSSTQLVVTEELSGLRNVDQNMDVICVKTVFRLLDVLNKKHRDLRTTAGGKPSAEYKKLGNFLAKFSMYQLAEKSFERKEYARSLLYMEEYLSKNEKVPDVMDKHLAFLAKTYVYLNDVDNVKGLFATHSVKLSQPQYAIMLHEITDQFQDATICYQQLLKQSDEERSLLYEKRIIHGYLAMNQAEMALRFANSVSAARMKSFNVLDDVKCEALWNLSRYDDLEKLISGKKAQIDENWGVRIGQAVVHFLNRNENSLGDEIKRIRKTITKSIYFSSAAFGGYKECYDSVIKLHILNEFEKLAQLVFAMLNDQSGNEWESKFQSVIKLEFEERLKKLQPVSRVLQPVLNIRQALFSVGSRLSTERPDLVASFNEEIRKCWLKVIEIANRTRNFQLAYSNILAIDNYQLKGFFIEKAKYYWEKMEQREALRTLQHGLQFHYKNFKDMVRSKTIENSEDRKICAEAMLLIGTYNDAMVNTDLVTNLEYFQNATKLYPESEKTLVKYAQYLDKICAADATEQLYRQRSDYHMKTVQLYGQSLNYGCEFIYQSLSRMLNVWMDFGSALNADKRNRQDDRMEERRKAFREMNRHIETFILRLPTYYFCTAFSLIMSRLSHPLTECFDKLSMIVIKCILSYPNQVLWQFMSLHRTKNRVLQDRVHKILRSPDLSSMTPMVRKFQELFEQFSAVCLNSRKINLPVGATLLTNITKKTSLLKNNQFDDILIPSQKLLTIVLPRSVKDLANENDSYNPYPEKMVYISRIRNEIHIYGSLQKPIRVSLVGTDGRDHPMIFKAYDDMRIDCRCMEFNSVVNMYLKRDVEARDRTLNIRTYTVLPLLDKCGIIEFIPNLQSMRCINTKMRRSFGLSNVSVKQYECALNDTLEKKRKHFHQLVTLFPPLLHEWYKLEFPNPTSWYAARTAYTRTLAVMSIVGYTVGLGDRHNDNILLDSTNGDVIHVDLNVLFNKGEQLQWPERVPFRLTHSMIKAMGPLGYEGSFLCTSEIVNRILRERKEQLISVLNTFLYDPPELPLAQGKDNVTAEQNLRNVEHSLRNVEHRLNGSITAFEKQPSIPLSVEGQTRKLIEEATNEDNLCQMFMGWSSFM